MEKVFEAINGVFSFIGPLSDFLWEFPTNFDWYSSIPILGNISFAIILLLGSGIFFSFRIGFMQVTYFKKGIRTIGFQDHTQSTRHHKRCRLLSEVSTYDKSEYYR